MKTVGIIAEYNPFHNGHKFHIEESRRLTGAECVVAVMSGNFVQRGEPAVYNKWLRAETAVRSGADLVIELPTVFACATAEAFAEAGVRLLSSLASVDYIAFGAEEDSLEKLQKVAELFTDESEEFKDEIKKNLKSGMSFASARAAAAEHAGMKEYGEIISRPNNILAVEYLKQLKILDREGCTQIPEPVLIKRKSAGYYEENPDEHIAGAGKLRDMMRDGLEVDDYMPESFGKAISESLGAQDEPCFSDSMFEFLEYKLLTENPEKLSRIDGAVEGLENRAVKAAAEAIDLESLINMIKSKRYSRTAVQRMLTRMLLGITKEEMSKFRACGNTYARVLAFSDKGAKLIKKIKKADLPGISIITNINKEKPEDDILSEMLEIDVKAGNIYDLLCYGRPGVHSDYRMKPYMHKEG